jgi:D-xylose transport system substrate-binding protein
MEAIIDAANAANQKIDAVLAENDSTALGVVAALKAKSYAAIPVSGQDGDTANLQNVAAGLQYVDVWKNANELGKAAGAAALQLCAGKKMADLALPDGLILPANAPAAGNKVQDFTTPGGNVVKSFILNVQPITQENLQLILDAKWLTKDVLCKNAAGSATAAPICK